MEAYLDYNATTPVDPQVFEEMRPYLTHEFGNASSFHKKGQAARHAIEQARERIADTLAVEPGDLIFTSGGTEADNLAIQGVMKYFESQRKHLVISAIEHQAVLAPALHFLKRGLKVTVIPVDKQGVVDLNFLEKSVTSDTALVSVMHVNNEVGTIQPIKAIAQIAHKKGALFHTDAVQSLGKITLDIASVDPDMVSCSAHKIYGPKGAGALYLKKGVKLKPMIRGGHQEKNIRPGTENVAAIAGFGKAAERLGQSPEKEKGRVLLLRNQLYEGLK
ncbi:MAG: cysteine desulfurase NifS, partial [Candidatus Omnitrophica bacterium CG07_land_8_20_14_0_80_50_8]